MALVLKDLSVNIEESQLVEEVYRFLIENYFKEDSDHRLDVSFNRKTISFQSQKDQKLRCTLIYDHESVYRDLTQKMKLILSTQPAILQVFYRLKEELHQANLLSEEGLSSYLLIIMLITSSQLDFEGRKVIGIYSHCYINLL